MIEIAVDEEKKRLLLVVDGNIYDDPTSVLPVGLSGSGDGVGLIIHSRSDEVMERLLQHRFSEFPEEPWTLELRSYHAVTQRIAVFEKQISHPLSVYRTNNHHFYLGFNISFDSHNWKRLWSVSEYERAFDEIVKEQGVPSELPNTQRIAFFPPHPYGPQPTHKIVLDVTSSNSTVEEEIRNQWKLIRQLHDLTESSLQSRLRNESVVVRFEFTEEAKTACEQYLLYFVRFLEDIGVETTAELRHDAGQVLFAVTPRSKSEALDKIRAALDVYLSIPMGNLTGIEVDITTQRLASNIHHLRGQLALAQAVIQAKDATIQAQQATLAQQQHWLGSSIVIDSVVKGATQKDTEPVFNGLAEITKYQGKGFNVNLPELFRRLREFFEKD